MKVTRFDPNSDLIIGLSFLRHFNVELRFAEGRLLLDRKATT